MAANYVVELIRDEDGSIGVSKSSLGDWKWLYCVMEGSDYGGVEDVDVISWEEIEQQIKTEFAVFKDDESDVCDENTWSNLWDQLIGKVKDDIFDAVARNEVLFVKVGGYSVEYDNCLVVMYSVSTD